MEGNSHFGEFQNPPTLTLTLTLVVTLGKNAAFSVVCSLLPWQCKNTSKTIVPSLWEPAETVQPNISLFKVLSPWVQWGPRNVNVPSA